MKIQDKIGSVFDRATSKVFVGYYAIMRKKTKDAEVKRIATEIIQAINDGDENMYLKKCDEIAERIRNKPKQNRRIMKILEKVQKEIKKKVGS